VDRVWSAARIGPDGLTTEEVVAEYTQTITLTVAELTNVVASHPDDKPIAKSKVTPARLTAPRGLHEGATVQLIGGGTLVFDQFAKLRFHQRKGLAWNNEDIGRQQERLNNLAKRKLIGNDGAATLVGPTTSMMLHEASDASEEAW
jgi:hypothetical protein